MPLITLRAYLCDRATCGLMGMDLAQWSAKNSRPVLILPGEWLRDPETAGAGFGSLARLDKELAEKTGALEFPIMFEDIKSTPLAGGTSRVIRDADWLGFSR